MNTQCSFSHAVSKLAAAVPICACIAALVVASPGVAHANPAWCAVYGGTSNGYDRPFASVVNKRGDLIVVGQSQTINHHRGITTLEYDPSGKQLWAHAETVHDSFDDDANIASAAVALDPSSGDVTVFGVRIGDSVATVASYAPTGKRLSRTEISVPAYGAIITGLQLYPDGDFSITGSEFVNNQASGLDYSYWVVARYDATGDLLWYDNYSSGTNPSPDSANHVAGAALDSSGNLVVGGDATAAGQPEGIVVRTYDEDGNVLSTGMLSDPLEQYEEATGFALDANDNAYVSGNAFTAPVGFPAFLLAKFSSDGGTLWRGIYAPPFPDGTPGAAASRSLTLDSDGNAIVGGSDAFDGNRLLVKWDSVGHGIWAQEGTEAFQEDFLFGVPGSDEFCAVGLGSQEVPSAGGYVTGIVTSRFGSDGLLHSSQFFSGVSPSPGDIPLFGASYDARHDSVYALTFQNFQPDGSDYNWVTLKDQLGS